MGQKGIIATLKKKVREKNILVYNDSQNVFQHNYRLIRLLQFLLSKKKIIIITRNLDIQKNKASLCLTMFYKSLSIDSLKKKLSSKKSKSNVISKNLVKTLKQELLLFKVNFLNISFKILNKNVDKKITLFFYLKLNRFEKLLFARRLSFFFDFLKITSLFCNHEFSPQKYIFILSDIFKVLPKNIHVKFFLFLKTLVYLLITKLNNPSQRGVKIQVKGKLKGKLRKSAIAYKANQISNKFTCQEVTFNKVITNTKIGTFSFKFWLY